VLFISSQQVASVNIYSVPSFLSIPRSESGIKTNLKNEIWGWDDILEPFECGNWFQVPYKVRNFLTWWARINFWRRALPCVITFRHSRCLLFSGKSCSVDQISRTVQCHIIYPSTRPVQIRIFHYVSYNAWLKLLLSHHLTTCEAHWASQEIPHVVGNPKFLCFVHSCLALFPIQSRVGSVHTLAFYFFKIHFNVFLQSMFRSSRMVSFL
jgi:hypothetical protein